MTEEQINNKVPMETCDGGIHKAIHLPVERGDTKKGVRLGTFR